MSLHYRPLKVIETTTVSDDVLERLINEWQAQGYELDQIRFVTTEASRRPAMAFLFFLAPELQAEDDNAA